MSGSRRVKNDPVVTHSLFLTNSISLTGKGFSGTSLGNSIYEGFSRSHTPSDTTNNNNYYYS